MYGGNDGGWLNGCVVVTRIEHLCGVVYSFIGGETNNIYTSNHCRQPNDNYRMNVCNVRMCTAYVALMAQMDP